MSSVPSRDNPALTNDETAQYPLKTVREYKGEKYRYVQVKDAVAATAKKPAVWKDRASGTVTCDVSAAEDTAYPRIAGFLQGTVTEDYYTFIKCKGSEANVPKLAGDDSIAPHTPLISGDTAEDGVLKSASFDASSDGNPTDTELGTLAKMAASISVWAEDTSEDTGANEDTVDVYFDCA